MEMYEVKHAVVLFIFIRQDSVIAIINCLRQVQPKRLYIVGEGYRLDKPGEKERVIEVRNMVRDSINWPCEVYENFVEFDIGAGKRISSGINWVFEREDKAIFIEDDVIPSLSFFRFCDEMLETYEDQPNIMAISGNNVIPDFDIMSSYTFSSIPFIWGWATWKRAWKSYDYHISSWKDIKKSGLLKKKIQNKRFYELREHEFDLAYKGIDYTWDYQWAYQLLINDGLCIVPHKNLVRNVGIGEGATNTRDEQPMKDRPADEITFPLSHPDSVKVNQDYDDFYFRNYLFRLYYTKKSSRIKYHISRILGYRLYGFLRSKFKRIKKQ